jgi:hypothetical protein
MYSTGDYRAQAYKGMRVSAGRRQGSTTPDADLHWHPCESEGGLTAPSLQREHRPFPSDPSMRRECSDDLRAHASLFGGSIGITNLHSRSTTDTTINQGFHKCCATVSGRVFSRTTAATRLEFLVLVKVSLILCNSRI